MSFPTVNGIDMDTDDDTNNRPTAIESGLRSGLANATILRNEDDDWEFASDGGSTRDIIDDCAFGWEGSEAC